MAERAPKLEWRQDAAFAWSARSIGVALTIYEEDGGYHWYSTLFVSPERYEPTLLAAQLAAEDAAKAWLLEGLAALGVEVKR